MNTEVTKYRCKDGIHVEVNNTTGRCPLCGKQIETPSGDGFAKAQYLESQSVSDVVAIAGTVGIVPIQSTQSIQDFTPKKNHFIITREEAKKAFDNFGKTFTLEEARQDVHILLDRIYDSFEKRLENEVRNNLDSEEAKSIVISGQREELNKLRAENGLLKQCVDEAIKKPMGVEPHIYSDWKMKQNEQ